jgi:hypothetical protein
MLAASGGLLQDIQDNYIESVYDLPAAQEAPLIQWQQANHVKAWIHILGFKEMARINGLDYVNGDPAKLAIVRGSAEVMGISGIFDSLDKSITAERIPETKEVKALLHTLLKWHTEYCDDKGCFVNGRFSEDHDFNTIVPSPEIFTPSLEEIHIIDLTYNHSEIKQRRLYINTSPLITHYIVTTPNGSIKRRLQIGQVDFNLYGIPYANFSSFETWNITGEGITNQGNTIVLSSLNESYSIQAFTPFGEIQHLEPIITYKEDNWQPSDSIASIVFFIIFVLMVLFGAAYYMRRK